MGWEVWSDGALGVDRDRGRRRHRAGPPLFTASGRSRSASRRSPAGAAALLVSEETRCPVCGLGTVRDIAYDEAPVGNAEPPAQDADSRQVVTYTCGHQVVGPRLSVADPEVLDVEQRTAEETVEPVRKEE